MKDDVLARVAGDMAAGDYGKARDRLHGLIGAYPDDLSLRRKLGDVYSQLQFPAMAGRYWYLEHDRSATMEEACRAFEQSCGGDPLRMLLALKFRGDIDRIRDRFAGQTLLALQARASRESGRTIEFGKRGEAKYRQVAFPRTENKLLLGACLLFVLVAVALMLIGLGTVLGWLA